MSGTPLYEFDIDCDLSISWRQFWRSEKFYLDFLRAQNDIDIVLGKWEPEGSPDTFIRTLECSHPVKVSFPGTPSHTRCYKSQKMTISNNNTALVMVEKMRFEGIPYSDYFTLETIWHINECSSPINSCSGDLENGSGGVGSSGVVCTVKVYTKVEFLKWSMLQGTISSNTESEAREGVQLWHKLAAESLLKSLPKRARINQASDGDVPKWFSVLSLSPRNSSQSLHHMSQSEMITQEAKEELARQSSIESQDDNNDSIGGGSSVNEWEDSDSEFFDIEFTKDSDAGYSDVQAGLLSRSTSFKNESQLYEGMASDTHDSTLKVVRSALVVVLQFAWWRIRSASIDTWGPLFAPDPSTVAKRLVKSLVPLTLSGGDFDCSAGRRHPHDSLGREVSPTTSLAILTSNPDLFVPTMLVLSLAQVLLWCIDVTGRGHIHCRRETLLGTALLVSSSTWVGASLWYHLVSYLLGSRLQLVQSFTVVGYGLIGTCVSLIASQLLVLLRRELVHGPAHWASVNPEWGLFAFGIPSGIALAIVFSQSTPVKQKRTPNNSPSASSRSLVGAAARKTKQTAEWVWPKALCFLVVLATHLELLRYIHHVVIPGEQKLCAMWSNMLPEDIARFDYKEIKKLAHTIKKTAPFKF